MQDGYHTQMICFRGGIEDRVALCKIYSVISFKMKRWRYLCFRFNKPAQLNGWQWESSQAQFFCGLFFSIWCNRQLPHNECIVTPHQYHLICSSNYIMNCWPQMSVTHCLPSHWFPACISIHNLYSRIELWWKHVCNASAVSTVLRRRTKNVILYFIF